MDLVTKYNRAAPNWDAKIHQLGYFQAYSQFLAGQTVATGSVLDVGTGTGTFAQAWIARGGSAELTLLDRHYLLYAIQGTIRLEAQGQRWTLPPARAALIAANQPITISILSKLTSASVLFAPDFMPAPTAVLSVFDVSALARELVVECRAWAPDCGPLTPYAHSIFDTLAAVVLNLAKSPSPCVLPTPTSYTLRRIRMIRAVEALASSDALITEIAMAVGDNSLSSFNVAFRDLTGKSPSQYRATFQS
jgi:hypothetical protein